MDGFQPWLHVGVDHEAIKCACSSYPRDSDLPGLGWGLGIAKFQKPSTKFFFFFFFLHVILKQQGLRNNVLYNGISKFLILLHSYICPNPPSHADAKAFICQQVTSIRMQ